MSTTEKELDAEIRRSGDLVAALRFMVRQLADGRLSDEQQRKLSAYGKAELTRLGAEA